jgi:hypothetical protein
MADFAGQATDEAEDPSTRTALPEVIHPSPPPPRVEANDAVASGIRALLKNVHDEERCED